MPRISLAIFAALLISVCGSAESSSPASGDSADEILIGITPVILADRSDFLEQWEIYLSQRLSRPARFVQRKTYKEIVDMLLRGNLDAAWICGYPFVQYRDQLNLVAVPLYQGEPLYQSYLIVGADDSSTAQISDVGQRIFAYSDPDSNSGFLVPQYQLRIRGIDPNHFFRRSFFTWSHEDVIEAVAAGVADAGAVDGYVWDSLNQITPQLTSGTRIAWRSPKYGFPPIVSPRNSPTGVSAELRSVLTRMAEDNAGREILGLLNIDGFSIQEPTLYDGILQQMRFLQDIPAIGDARP